MQPNYSKKIICLASSRKPGGRCVAGKEVLVNGYGGWIRPISTRDGAEINLGERQYQNGREPEILEIISIPMIGPHPRVHQRENEMIDSRYYWSKEGVLSWEELVDLVDQPTTLWSNGFSTYAGNNDRVPQEETTTIQNSLWLIKPSRVTICVAAPGADFGNFKRAVRAEFLYQGIQYNLKVTDLIAERAFLANENGEYPLEMESYLCVSLAEAHTDGYCYKLVATIMTQQAIVR